jgi:hypothetical protein
MLKKMFLSVCLLCIASFSFANLTFYEVPDDHQTVFDDTSPDKTAIFQSTAENAAIQVPERLDHRYDFALVALNTKATDSQMSKDAKPNDSVPEGLDYKDDALNLSLNNSNFSDNSTVSTDENPKAPDKRKKSALDTAVNQGTTFIQTE